MAEVIWQHCLGHLQAELPAQQFNTWIKPLQIDSLSADQTVRLIAPNRFVKDWVVDKFLDRINELASEAGHESTPVEVAVNSKAPGFVQQAPAVTQPIAVEPDIRLSSDALQLAHSKPKPVMSKVPGSIEVSHQVVSQQKEQAPVFSPVRKERVNKVIGHPDSLNNEFRFENFIEGKSNQLALAAARQIAENPGGSYNPLFIYGGVGLGKTHLMHAVGNALKVKKPDAKIVYLHSERFVADMVKALQLNAINDFKRFYRSVDALLIDDIQFFAGKERSQEEFFHTFNALLEGDHQMILTCDRYPKEIDGLEERLKSRFGWGLTVAVEPPELETRVAILIEKAQGLHVELPHDAAFFIAQRISSNVRELEGALKRVIASAHFTGKDIDVPMVRDSLKDLLALQDRLVSIDNIQRTVAEHYRIKMSDMLSKRRTRSVARPRQVAMAMAKQMTNHSLPEIGEAFGGRDHTTVLHACRKVKELQDSSTEMRKDIKLLTRLLTS